MQKKVVLPTIYCEVHVQSLQASIGRHVGPMSFFRAMKSDETLRREPGQRYWSWSQWDRFFELAIENGLLSYDTVNGQTRMTFPVLSLSLLNAWGRMRAARKADLSSYQFWQQEEALRERQRLKMERMTQRPQPKVWGN